MLSWQSLQLLTELTVATKLPSLSHNVCRNYTELRNEALYNLYYTKNYGAVYQSVSVSAIKRSEEFMFKRDMRTWKRSEIGVGRSTQKLDIRFSSTTKSHSTSHCNMHNVRFHTRRYDKNQSFRFT